jgi:hypothetical protein
VEDGAVCLLRPNRRRTKLVEGNEASGAGCDCAVIEWGIGWFGIWDWYMSKSIRYFESRSTSITRIEKKRCTAKCCVRTGGLFLD